ncbi:hypothetical protein EDD17DRAFT_1613857 [Pisolithus thermaeus]|nr:hypothetical protein EDD17DRAFT_1613857 [Pisolithus thermaeus]
MPRLCPTHWPVILLVPTKVPSSPPDVYFLHHLVHITPFLTVVTFCPEVSSLSFIEYSSYLTLNRLALLQISSRFSLACVFRLL